MIVDEQGSSIEVTSQSRNRQDCLEIIQIQIFA